MQKKSPLNSGSITARTLIVLLVSAAACLIVTGRLPAFLRSEAPANVSQRTLSFSERVTYQRAIEDVYWRHRIWPKERPDTKPSLDAGMSNAQLEKKVTDYLRKSRALENYWQRPITAAQLQAEMERMAKNTRQPKVLRELFAALGNDPFIIAECLIRPILADRSITNWYAYDSRIHGDLKRRAQTDIRAHPSIAEMNRVSGNISDTEFVRSDSAKHECDPGHDHRIRLEGQQWDETVKQLSASFGLAGSEIRNVREFAVAKDRSPLRAHPAVALYQSLPIGKLSALQEDEDRYYAVAVLEKGDKRLRLGTIEWRKKPLDSWLAGREALKETAAPHGSYKLPTISGSACTNDTWTATAGPPEPRSRHAAVWTGSEMIIWGGLHFTEYLNSGGRYTPSTDTWVATDLTNAPAPRVTTAAWTGSEMVVWGGHADNGLMNTGGKYNPSTNSWTATTTVGAPSARSGHSAVWTGNEMVVWGGQDLTGYANTGAKYRPDTDAWLPTNTTNAPSGRENHTAVWTGAEMVVWGGYDGINVLNSGGKYDPGNNTWVATNATNAPDARVVHSAIWTGTEMIVWGGVAGFVEFNTGGRYNPDTNTWTATSTTNAPDARQFQTAVWTGSEMVIWGGSGNLNTGGKYDPQTDSWTATSLTNAPAGRYSHSVVWADHEMIVWGGDDQATIGLNTGGRYDPVTNSWVATGTQNAPTGRYRHTWVWTGSELIVWGGVNRAVGALDTGAKYSPTTDSWTPITLSGTPSGRAYHATVWTGSEMIVWGGFSSAGYFNTGGRYNPGTNNWVATTTVNAPVARELPTAVWSGNAMIVWGGYYYDGSDHYLNTGGRYNPGTDSWTTTTTTNAPVGREFHTAVWTGSQMVVWGGYYYDGVSHELNTGGRYDPNTDSWTVTSTTNVPSARDSHRALWTGSEMIVWGGFDNVMGYSNSGGRYNSQTDSWTGTSTINAPIGRAGHSLVWTGNEMIVWGGLFYDGDYHFLNDGGRYDPGSNSWTEVSLINAPSPRDLHAAVWTGDEMIIWGGLLFANIGTGTGGRYCAQSGPTPSPTPTPTPCTGRCSPTPRPRPTPAPRP